MRRFVRFSLVVAAALAVASIALGLTYWYWINTVHTVIPGKLYRSAQLTGPQFARNIRRYHIRSVINLRGAHPGVSWYDSEVAATQHAGATHIDLKMYSYRLPSKARFDQLVKILQTAPTPILVHCNGGVDRTGLASATYILLNNGSLAQAKAQISLLTFAIYPHSVGRLVLPIYRHWLKARQERSSRQHFLRWLPHFGGASSAH